MSRPLSSTILVLAAGLLSGCASVLNEPINLPAVEAANAAEFVAPSSEDNATLIGLSFSGGGTRAAAFAYGVLKEMAATPLPGEGGKRNLIETFRSEVNGRGMHYQAAELERLAAAGSGSSPLMPVIESVAIMAALDEIRRQIGVRYPSEGSAAT